MIKFWAKNYSKATYQIYNVICRYTELHSETLQISAVNEAHALFKAENIARDKGYTDFWCEV